MELLRGETRLLGHQTVWVWLKSRLLGLHETSLLRLQAVLFISLLQPLLLAELTQALTWRGLEGSSARHTSQLSLERRWSELALLLKVLWC